MRADPGCEAVVLMGTQSPRPGSEAAWLRLQASPLQLSWGNCPQPDSKLALSSLWSLAALPGPGPCASQGNCYRGPHVCQLHFGKSPQVLAHRTAENRAALGPHERHSWKMSPPSASPHPHRQHGRQDRSGRGERGPGSDGFHCSSECGSSSAPWQFPLPTSPWDEDARRTGRSRPRASDPCTFPCNAASTFQTPNRGRGWREGALGTRL